MGERSEASTPVQPVVAHIVSELRPGGVEMRTYELLRFLHPTDEAHIVYTMSGRKGPLAADYESLSVKVLALKMRSLAFPFHFVRSLRRERVTVVHSNIHYSSGFLLMLAHFAGVSNLICHFRSDGPKKNGAIDRAKARILKLLISRFATAIVAVSPGSMDGSWGGDWRSDPRCQVLQNGLDLDTYESVEPANLQEFGIAAHAYPVIAHVGRADLPTKNREKAIRVVAELRKQHPDAVLLFVGRDGRDEKQVRENRSRWEQLMHTHGVQTNVVFAGERKDVKQLLAASDTFLLTSTLEGLPGVLLEAMAVGLPVISTTLPGARFIHEVVGGVALLDADDSDSTWARTISDALPSSNTQERHQHGSAPHCLRDSAFDLHVSSQKYLDLWNS